jgi:carbamoyl-phosphate synthase small subunit
MGGYQEILTDPSYKGQMVVMTVAHVGNYGINPEDVESAKPHVEGFIVREACHAPSSWRSRESLPAYLKRNGIVGISGIDTRALVTVLREKGALRGVISTKEGRKDVLVDKAKSVPPIEEKDLVQEVSCAKPYEWREPVRRLEASEQIKLPAAAGPWRVVVVDCGVKFNILRSLASNACLVTVVPAFSTTEEIMSHSPDGVLFSNGPGDPDRLPKICEAMRGLLGKVPVFGICLGHQVMGRAFGGRTYKLKFGHHGGNQPVRHEPTGTVAITVQNHNFVVDPATLPAEVEVTHLNLNDRSVEGQRHKGIPAFSVQYHPESCPGPHDASGHFREFTAMMAAHRAGGTGPGS